MVGENEKKQGDKRMVMMIQVKKKPQAIEDFTKAIRNKNGDWLKS